MSQIGSKLSPVVAASIAALLGMSIYSMRTSQASASSKAQDKRDLGLQGAGIGGNKNAGGPEFGFNPAEEQPQTPASKSQLPSGEIGGGEGKGGTSARNVELPKVDSQASTASGYESGILSSTRRLFGQTSGGSTDTATGAHADASPGHKRHDTKVASSAGSETPSKHGP